MEFQEYVNRLAAEFDEFCNERHQFGQQKYGVLTFLGKDIITEALQEVGDLANYARYQYIKLRILQDHLNGYLGELGLTNPEGDVTIGVAAFTPNNPERS